MFGSFVIAALLSAQTILQTEFSAIRVEEVWCVNRDRCVPANVVVVACGGGSTKPGSSEKVDEARLICFSGLPGRPSALPPPSDTLAPRCWKET
uniref:Putative secreted protein n=1 Tax=Anopheles darlingi TaxID=43151 RepID=A0A2M4DFZ0_ANODA